jgi:hypothetical protein
MEKKSASEINIPDLYFQELKTIFGLKILIICQFSVADPDLGSCAFFYHESITQDNISGPQHCLPLVRCFGSTASSVINGPTPTEENLKRTGERRVHGTLWVRRQPPKGDLLSPDEYGTVHNATKKQIIIRNCRDDNGTHHILYTVGLKKILNRNYSDKNQGLFSSILKRIKRSKELF